MAEEARRILFVMVEGKRKRQLAERFEILLTTLFVGRVLKLDEDCASRGASAAAQKRLLGQTIDFRDAMIAGIALAHGAALATGNTRHFQGIGFELIDPLAPS